MAFRAPTQARRAAKKLQVTAWQDFRWLVKTPSLQKAYLRMLVSILAERRSVPVCEELRISSMDRVGTSGVDYMALWVTYDQAKQHLMMSQRAYTEASLRKFGFENLKSMPTPTIPNALERSSELTRTFISPFFVRRSLRSFEFLETHSACMKSKANV